MNGICGHLSGTTCSNCAPQWASIAPWSSLPPDALGRIADALESLVDAYAQTQRRDHYALSDRYAANEARQREEAAEPDPLNEDNHEDRMTGDGYLLTRNGPRHWHWHSGNPVPCSVVHVVGYYSLAWWDEARGPLTFAPDASPAPQDAAQSAADGESDAVEGGGPAEPSEALLCHECRHGINRHGASDATQGGCDSPSCTCPLWPSQIARHWIAQATP